MECNRLYRSLFLIDDTRNYTNDFYISEFVKIVLFNEGCFSLSLEDIHRKIEELASLEYTKEDITYSLSIWNNGEIEENNGLYSLTSSGEERISKRKKASDLNVYIDLFLRQYPDKYNITKKDFESLLERFIYQRFNENLKEISDILNHCLAIDEFDKKYDDIEKEIINDFLSWDNVDKNECIYKLIAKAYDYCMINSKCQAQEVVFSKIHFYLDTNIIFRLMGINGSERESSIKSLIDKCRAAGIKLVVSNFVVDECEYTINSQIQVLIDSTMSMNTLIPPATMSFAEEKSIKLDFYRRYYEWVREGNKHRNYDGFKKCVLREFDELLQSFSLDKENTSFKVVCASDFAGYYDSLYTSKMDKHTTETDINSLMLILDKRKVSGDDNEYFLISADQRLVSWSREVFPGQKSFVDIPSVWLSIILKYTGREKESDYRAFCQFIHLSIEPQIDDLEKKIAIKSSIMSTDIDDDIKTMMIDEVRDNYNHYRDYDSEKIVHVTYAKAKGRIEAEVEQKKDLEFCDKLSAAQKGFEERFDRQQRDLESLLEKSKAETIEAYTRGRRDLANELEEERMEGMLKRKIARNKKIRGFINTVLWVLFISATISWILLLIFGMIEADSPIVGFFEKYGVFFSVIGYLLGALGKFSERKIEDRFFSIDKEMLREKIRNS